MDSKMVEWMADLLVLNWVESKVEWMVELTAALTVNLMAEQ